MTKITPTLSFFLQLAKIQAVITRRFDAHLGAHHGLGFSDFIILYHLYTASGEKLRRIDLAEKLGLTASGVTRLLAPMEKIGLIKREATEHDARVSFVTITSGGKRLFEDALITAEETVADFVPAGKDKKIHELLEVLVSFPGHQYYR